MQIFLAIFLVTIGIGVFLVMRKPTQSKKATAKAPKQKTGNGPAAKSSASDFPFQSVSIMTAKICCDGATNLSGQKFLIKQAPKLPLSQCTSCACKCGYIRHTDRRDDDGDRRALYGLRAELHALQNDHERRTRTGRRSIDFAPA